MSLKRLEAFDISDDDFKNRVIPKFRTVFDEDVIQPIFDLINLRNLNKQYSIYVEGMDLLSYDRIKKNFLKYS